MLDKRIFYLLRYDFSWSTVHLRFEDFVFRNEQSQYLFLLFDKKLLEGLCLLNPATVELITDDLLINDILTKSKQVDTVYEVSF